MGKCFIYIFILVIIAVSCNKDPEISKAQEDFHLKVFGGSSTDSCNAIISDGENIYLTGSITLMNGPDMFLIKTDKNGNEINWSPKLFGSAGTDVGYDICMDKQQNIYMAGFTKPADATNTNVFVVKTDSNGEELWARSFGGSRDEQAYAINTTNEQVIYVAGYTESVAYNIKRRQGWILALSENGDSIWSHDYGTNSAMDELRGITDIKDSLLLIGTTETLFGNFQQDVFLFILKKSTRGIENSITLYRAGNENGVSAIYHSGYIYVLGFTRINSTVNNIVLWKLGEDLQVIKEQLITSGTSETPSAILANNGSFVVVGTAMNDQGNENFLTYVIDQELEVISRNIYGSIGKGNQKGKAGVISGKSVVIGGCTISGSTSKASIFKTPDILP
jgi:hypothetical protein